MRAATDGAREILLENYAVIPGLVNCHTHLELASLERLPADNGFVAWIRSLLEKKADLTEETIMAAAEHALLELLTLGTAFVADVSSSALTSLALLRTGFPGMVFREFLGFDADAVTAFEQWEPHFEAEGLDGVRFLPACHAPFSTSADLFEAVRDWSEKNNSPTMVHLAESKEETDLLTSGKSPLLDLLQEKGHPPDRIPTPRTGSVPYLDGLSFLTERTVAVHLVEAGEADLKTLQSRGVKPCLCPSSNRHLFDKLPPVQAMLDAGLHPCLGTDSSASGDSPNLFKEMEILLDAGIPAETVLAMGTLNGRNALGLSEDYGCLEPGGAPAILALPVDWVNGHDPLESALRAGVVGGGKWIITPLGLLGNTLDSTLEEPDPEEEST